MFIVPGRTELILLPWFIVCCECAISSDISGRFVGHFIFCRTYLVVLSDISGFVGHFWPFCRTFQISSDISGRFVGHFIFCRTFLAVLSDISGFVGHFWPFCRTFLAVGHFEHCGHFEPLQGRQLRKPDDRTCWGGETVPPTDDEQQNADAVWRQLKRPEHSKLTSPGSLLGSTSTETPVCHHTELMLDTYTVLGP